MVDMDNYISINGKLFKDVTNQTVASPTYTYAETVAIAHGRRIEKIYYGTTNDKKKGGSK